MKFFIAYLLSNEAKIRHLYLNFEIEKYFKLTRSSPPHVTLKRPFEADESKIREIDLLLAKFTAANFKTPLKLSGFGSFSDEVVFVDVVPSAGALKVIGDLDRELCKVVWLDFDVFEKNRKLHATLVHGEKVKRKFAEILSLLSQEKFEFDVWFDNISILRKRDGSEWEVYKKYDLK